VRIASISLLLALGPAVAGAQAPACPATPASVAQPAALVLSGGGARGLAHIGVLRVLDSLGIRPPIVVGTSMGALIGALYAGGLSGRQIDSLVRRLPFATLFRRYAPITLLTAGDFASPITSLAPTFVVEFKGGTLSLQSPVAREPEINALFNEILLPANLTAAGDFDRLPRRFRAVATDMRKRSTVVLAEGDLAEAVRASIAIPVVFAPVERDGRLLVDGGLSANVPVSVARNVGAARVLVSDVGASVADSTDGTTTASMLSYLIDELFSQPPDSLGADDVRIRPEVRDFNPLEFTDAVVGPLIDAGYRAAAERLRGCAPSPAPAIATTPSPRTADAGRIADRLARLADEGAYETVWLRPRLVSPSLTTIDSSGVGPASALPSELRFAPVAVLAPERVASVGLSYDAQEGARAWLSATSVSSAGGRLSFGSALSMSEWRQQFLLTATGVRRHALPANAPDSTHDAIENVRLPDPRSDTPPWSMLTRNLLHPELSLTASREIVRLYDARGHERERPATRDLVLFAGLGVTPTAGQRIVVGPVAHLWTIRSGALPVTDESRAFGGMARAARWFTPPANGPDLNTIPAVAAEGLWLDRYRRFDLNADLRFQRGEFILRPRAAAGWGDRLPLDAQFILGGPQGFPGLRTGERRGDRLAFASVSAMRAFAGPFYLRGEAGGGYTALAHSRPVEGLPDAGRGWVQGVELGVASDTPFGPFAIAVGVATTDRPVFKISLGR
jgi:predicted acylesterase/phospholipase RssA